MAAFALLGSAVLALVEAVLALTTPTLSAVSQSVAALYVVGAIITSIWYVGAPLLCALFAWLAFRWVRFVVIAVAVTQFLFLGGPLTWMSALLTVLAAVLLWLPAGQPRAPTTS